jgi:hypothetical protein
LEIYGEAITSFGCIFVFDGLDEISSQTYKEIERLLLSFIKDIKKKSEYNEIYITAREQFYNSNNFNRKEFNTIFPQIASIIPFTDIEIYDMVQ